jgi:hypothetical protein
VADGGVHLAEAAATRCSRHCSPDALRMTTVSRSQSRAHVHSPGACSPPLLIDSCATNTVLRCPESREAGGFAWHSAARRGKQNGFGLNDEKIGASSGGGWRMWARKIAARSELVGSGSSDKGGRVTTPMVRSDSAQGTCSEGNCPGGLGRLVASWAGLTRG